MIDSIIYMLITAIVALFIGAVCILGLNYIAAVLAAC